MGRTNAKLSNVKLHVTEVGDDSLILSEIGVIAVYTTVCAASSGTIFLVISLIIDVRFFTEF